MGFIMLMCMLCFLGICYYPIMVHSIFSTCTICFHLVLMFSSCAMSHVLLFCMYLMFCCSVCSFFCLFYEYLISTSLLSIVSRLDLTSKQVSLLVTSYCSSYQGDVLFHLSDSRTELSSLPPEQTIWIFLFN
jgi:hypothetical protein